MNDKFPLKEPKTLKTEMKKLISFEEKDDLLKSQRKATDPMDPNSDKNLNMMELLSKYATVRSCYFVKHAEESSSAKEIGVQKGGFFQVT